MTRNITYRSLNLKAFLTFLIFGAFSFGNRAQEFTYYNEGQLKFTNWTYDSNIRSIKLHKPGNELSEAILPLEGGEGLVLNFDDLSDTPRRIWYTLIHCDALWLRSQIQTNEYLEGFTEAEIHDYMPSRNTIQQYRHYQVHLPDDNMRLLISGNYLLKVYAKNEEEELLFTRRVVVYESLVSLNPVIRFATDLDARNYFQEVRFTIDKSGFYVVDPFRDLRVIIRQNGHWEASITTLKPRMVKGDILEYDYDRGNYFSGGNEFRQFDIKSFKYFSPQTARRYRDQQGYHVELMPDERRTFKIYRSETDINGRFLLISEDVSYPETESEYAWVRFQLPYDAPLFHGSIYVFGELTGWEYTPEARMDYDYRSKSYQCTLLLKQGYYNYQYVFLENNARQADESFIEGRHSETRNEYYFFVFHRGPWDRYDRVIGFAAAGS